MICHYCHKPGHYRQECPDRLKAVAETTPETPSTTRTVTSRDPRGMQGSSSSDVVPGVGSVEEETLNNPSSVPAEPQRQPSPVDPSIDTKSQPFFDNRQHIEWLEYIRKFPPPPFPLPMDTGSEFEQFTSALTTPTVADRPAEHEVPHRHDEPCEGDRATEATTTAESNVRTAGNTFFVEIRIGKRRCPGLIDTGSEVTLLPKRFADLSQLVRTSRTLRAANGTLINILGEWHTTVSVGSLRVATNFIVSDQIDELLIGIDWLKDNRCVLSFSDFTIHLQGCRFPLLKRVGSNACNRVILEEAVVLPAKSETVVHGRLVYANFRKRLPEVAVTETKECCPGVKTARCLIQTGTGTNLPVRVLNVNSNAVSLNEGAPLCSIDEIVYVVDEHAQHAQHAEHAQLAQHAQHAQHAQPVQLNASSFIADPIKTEQIKKLMAGVHPDVPQEHVDRLEKLLNDISDIISRDEFDMGLTDLIEHEIDTGQERPVRQALRKTPMAHNEVIDAHVQTMLQQGLIEPSRGDWSSSVVLVLKKDKSYRFCIDYRKVNEVSRKGYVPDSTY